MKRIWALLCRVVLLLTLALLTVDACAIGFRYPAIGTIALAAAAWRQYRRGRAPSGAFGTARQAGWPDLIANRLLCRKGILLGRLGYVPPPTRGQAVRALLSPFQASELACRQFFAAFCGARRSGGFLRINDFVHLATFAPAGGGKSVSVLLPNLFSYAGNCVVVDPKGELFKLTAKHRRKHFKHTIVRLDPAGLFGPGDSFNPFDFIDPHARDFLERVRDLANMIVVKTGKELDPHWNTSAENIIAAFSAYVAACEGTPDSRSLRGLRTFLAARHLYEFAKSLMQEKEGFGGVLKQLGFSLSWHVEKELGSVMSTVNRHTNIFDSPLIAGCTGHTSFDPMALRHGRMTVYLIVPAEMLVVWSALQRLWLGSLIRIITRGVPTEKNPVLFLVDEAAHIGKMQAIEDAVTLQRGAGIRMWLFFQSLDQLHKCFGDSASTVLDNIGTQQYFSIQSYETAEILSKRIGDETILLTTTGGNDGTSQPTGGNGQNPGSISSGRSRTTSEGGRRWLFPAEILVLRSDISLVFHKHNYVILSELIKYYSDKAFRRSLIFRSWGTGRARGVGLGGMVLAVFLLALSGVVTAFLARVPASVWQLPPWGAPPASVFEGTAYAPSPVEPWRQPPPSRPAHRPVRRPHRRQFTP